MRISDWSSDVCSSDLIRGKDEQGRDLVIGREYLTQGLRERAAELVSLDLGPRTDIEIENRLAHEIEQERLTSIDRRLLRTMDDDRIVAVTDRDPFHQSLRAGRLQKLGHLGLADERSEEHTSELKSLMRISYAVFCLKKKTIQTTLKHDSY